MVGPGMDAVTDRGVMVPISLVSDVDSLGVGLFGE